MLVNRKILIFNTWCKILSGFVLPFLLILKENATSPDISSLSLNMRISIQVYGFISVWIIYSYQSFLSIEEPTYVYFTRRSLVVVNQAIWAWSIYILFPLPCLFNFNSYGKCMYVQCAYFTCSL